jgi:hypothetical protein
MFTDNYRPILVIGALSEWVVDKLIIDFPEQFHRCIVNQMRCSKEEIEMRLNNNSIIEYRRRGSLFECVSLQAVKDNKVRYKLILNDRFGSISFSTFLAITLHLGRKLIRCRASSPQSNLSDRATLEIQIS